MSNHGNRRSDSAKRAPGGISPFREYAIYDKHSDAFLLCPETDKLSFRTQRDAEAASNNSRSLGGDAEGYRGGLLGESATTSPYRCSDCPYWHLTSQEPDVFAKFNAQAEWKRIRNDMKLLMTALRADPESDLSRTALMNLEVSLEVLELSGFPQADSVRKRLLSWFAHEWRNERGERACSARLMVTRAMRSKRSDREERGWLLAAREGLVAAALYGLQQEDGPAVCTAVQKYLVTARAYLSLPFSPDMRGYLIDYELSRLSDELGEAIESSTNGDAIAQANLALDGIEALRFEMTEQDTGAHSMA